MVNLHMSSVEETEFKVSQKMFGGNYLATFYNPDNNFSDTVNLMSVTALRYPGGSITENSFSIHEPNRTADDSGRPITPISDFLDFCQERDLSATIVLPTRNLLDTERDENGHRYASEEGIKDTVDFAIDLLSERSHLGISNLIQLFDAFEIGNEYWGSGEMTGTEYGRIVNGLAPALYAELATRFGTQAANEIDLLVQMGAPWSRDHKDGGFVDSINSRSDPDLLSDLGLTRRDFDASGELKWTAASRIENELIIRELDSDARSAIGGLVEHYYFDNHTEDLNYSSSVVNYINSDISYWERNGITDRQIYLTEWNVSTTSLDQLGLRGAGALISQFEYMTRLGTDAAHVWPLLHNTRTELAGLYGQSPALSPSGYVFQHLASNVSGLTLQEIQHSSPGLEVVSFSGSESVVIYISSRVSTVNNATIYIDEFVGGREWNINSVEIVGVDLSTSDGLHRIGRDFVRTAPEGEHDALGKIERLDLRELSTLDSFDFRLDPYEVAMIVVGVQDGFEKDNSTDLNPDGTIIFDASLRPCWFPFMDEATSRYNAIDDFNYKMDNEGGAVFGQASIFNEASYYSEGISSIPHSECIDCLFV